jgi:HlyD family secretion protein
MTRRTKWSIFGAITLVILVAVVAVAATRGPKSVAVKIEPVAQRDLVASVTASGQVEPHTKVDMSADISGRIITLAVKEGENVEKGQLLVQIDPATYQAAVDRSKAFLAAANAQAIQAAASADQAQHNYDRSAAIKKSNALLISDEQLEQLRTALDVARATAQAARDAVDQAAAALRDDESALSKTTIRAPMAGKVTRLAIEQGETAIQGTLNKDAATLLTISDMSVLETKVKVDESDVAHIQVGDTAAIQLDAFPDTVFRGRVTKIANSAMKSAAAAAQGDNNNSATTDQAVDYQVTIQLLNPPRDTRPDFSATAKIITDTRSNAVSIPIIALTVRDNQSLPNGDTSGVTIGRTATPTKQVGKRDVEGVFVVGADNKVTFRPVKVGIAGETYFEVLNGLRPDERIVAGTYQAIRDLKDGTLVHEAKPEPTAAAQFKS